MNLNGQNLLCRVIISSNAMEKQISNQGNKKKRKTNELSDDFHEVKRVLLQVQSTAQSRGQLIFFHRGPDSKYFQLAGHILLCRCGTKEARDDT